MTMHNLKVESTNETSLRNLLSGTEIKEWLVSYLAKELEITPLEVDVTLPFDCYNMDSAITIGMVGDLESLLGCTLDPTLVYDYPTIELLAQHIGSGAGVSWQKKLSR